MYHCCLLSELHARGFTFLGCFSLPSFPAVFNSQTLLQLFLTYVHPERHNDMLFSLSLSTLGAGAFTLLAPELHSDGFPEDLIFSHTPVMAAVFCSVLRYCWRFSFLSSDVAASPRLLILLLLSDLADVSSRTPVF